MNQLTLSIILTIVFVAHIFYTKHSVMIRESWIFSLAYSVTFLVPPMSHTWHVLYGEDRLKCESRRKDVAFGWTPCFEWTWNTLVNTYEITLVIENLFFVILSYYVLWTMFKTSIARNTIAFALNTALLVLVLILSFASPDLLDTFYSTFNWAGLVLSSLLWGIVEIYVRLPYFGYNVI